jgi:DNA primase
MPAIDFRAVRWRVPPARVLELLGWRAVRRSGDELRGPCPLHRSDLPRSRSFAVNLRKGVFQCFHCGASGNLLDLYAAARGLSVYAAALELCERLGLEVPWLQRPRQPVRSQPTQRPGERASADANSRWGGTMNTS